jgi:hypothetical protein
MSGRRASRLAVSGKEHPLARGALEEVVALHGFFETWLRGTGPDTPAAFARLEAALAETFTMVSPEGTRLRRAEVLDTLRQAYGSRGRGGAFRIVVRELEILHLDPPLVVLGYIEEQDGAGGLTRRRSTAVLAAAAQDGGRPQWLALHETWIASDRRGPGSKPGARQSA